MFRRHWIPPLALITAQLAHGASWLIIFAAAWTGNFDNPLFGFAWIHTVALGWITMAALAILLHALPNFIDVEWAGQTPARWAIALYACGVALLLFGFLRNPAMLGIAGAIVLAALLIYLATAFGTVARGFRGERVERAVARAFGGTFLFLLATALMGFGLAWMLAGYAVPSWVSALPHAHAHAGTLGWLSLLIFGVSMRTFKPITRSGGTRWRWMHILVGSCAALGVILLATGVVWVGGALFAIAAIGYAADAFDIIRRARNPHRPPQAFIVASVVWLLTAMMLGGGVLLGKPWQSAYIFVLLMGWAGQMVNAHMYHIGIRLLATVYRGEDDETEPQELLETRLSWYTLAAFQLAVIVVTTALLQNNAAVAARGAVFGFTAWIAVIANVLVARYRAMQVRKKVSLLR